MATWGMRAATDAARCATRGGRPIVEEAARAGGAALHCGREELRATLLDPPANLGGAR